MESTSQAVNIVRTIVKGIVDYPDEVSVIEYASDAGTIIRVEVAVTDIGKVIGKQGRTARSIRTILGAHAMSVQLPYSLDIVEADVAVTR